MNSEMALQTCLKIWREEYSRPERQADQGGHLSDRILYGMALAGGFKKADSNDASHLSLCPVCLGKWAKLRRAVSDLNVSESYEDEKIVSWGMLEAAATDKPLEALSLTSSCGNFVLGVLPRVGDPESGMITLEVISDASSEMEDRRASVTDKAGRLLLQGVIRQGRLARKIEKLSKVNLAKWTVVVE